MMMRPIDVIITNLDGNSVNVVIKANSCKVKLYC